MNRKIRSIFSIILVSCVLFTSRPVNALDIYTENNNATLGENTIEENEISEEMIQDNISETELEELNDNRELISFKDDYIPLSSVVIKETIGGGSGRTWKQTIVYHSNYPDGNDDEYTVEYTVKSFISSNTALYNGSPKSYSQCGFIIPDGYILKNGWYDINGNAICDRIFPFEYTKRNTTTHLFAQYQMENSRFARITLRKKFENLSDIKIPSDFCMTCEYKQIVDGEAEQVKRWLYLKDATKIENNLYEWEVELPRNTDITFTEYNYQTGRYELIGIDGNINVVKKDHTIPNITFRLPAPLSAATRTITNYYNYVGISVPYRVEWYDKQENSIQENSYRSGIEDEIVIPTGDDYIVDGWIFDENDSRNILSKELKENEENVLKLYFYKVVPTVNLHFEKKFDATDKDFDKLKLDKYEGCNFFISLTSQETGEVINGLLDSKEGFRVTNIPIGTYIIKEQNDIWFKFVDMVLSEQIEGIDLQEIDGEYILTIGADVESETTIEIDITNKPDEERFYDSKYEIKNLFNLTR